MNISYRWLKHLIELDLPPQELAERLTNIGLAVDGIEEIDGDHIFDFDLTSNRPDCLSHLGIAREICVIDPGAKFRATDPDVPKPKNLDPKSPGLVTIQNPDLCHRFTARIIKNVKVGPSPDLLRKRLESVGERSINNVADITNYVMLELGQPMHAFDLDKLAENRIVVRRAIGGETLQTLDEVTRKLDDSMLAICDAEKPVAVAGVMGGFDSSITSETRNVLLEVAYFLPSNIRAASRNLGLSTEASHRFERGVDIENLIRASDRATELICRLAGGEAGDFIDIYPSKFQPKIIESADVQLAVSRLTGLKVTASEIRNIFDKLGIRANPQFRVFIPPSWRHDVSIEEDLVEELARVIGYHEIDSLIPPSTCAGEYQPHELRKFHLRQTLANLGFDEALSYSFIDTRHDAVFDLVPNFVHEGLDEQFVEIKDPIIEGSTRMRASLLAGLLDAVRLNFNQQRRDLKLFELGTSFCASDEEFALPVERELFAVAMTGHEICENKALEGRELDFYDAKGAVEAAVESLNLPAPEFAAGDYKHLRKGQSAEIRVNNVAVGSVGRLSEALSLAYKFRQPVFVAEIDLQTILASGEHHVLYRPLPVYPPVVRDVSILVKRSRTFAQIVGMIREQNFELLKNIYFVDVYEGKGIADDERSITIRLEYRSFERTLLEEEVEAVHTGIVETIESKFGAGQKS